VLPFQGPYCWRRNTPGFRGAAGLEVRVAFGGVWKESLTELSGGQRSLLALSLILAMLLFKPAPIYILDEVSPPSWPSPHPGHVTLQARIYNLDVVSPSSAPSSRGWLQPPAPFALRVNDHQKGGGQERKWIDSTNVNFCGEGREGGCWGLGKGAWEGCWGGVGERKTQRRGMG
jgi:hypothetical protein